MTMGAHDLVFVYEAPDYAIAARFSSASACWATCGP